MISVVVVCNKRNIKESHVLKSLKSQSAKYELIIVNNENNRNFTSASSALNYGGMKSVGEYIMFAHQDIEFLDNNFLTLAENYLRNATNVGIAGVAGMCSEGITHKQKQKNIIYHGYPIKKVWGNQIEVPENVQTLDECLLIVPATIFKKNKFDEIVCNDWHLYGVDYCLEVQKQNLSVITLPLPIYHLSRGDSAIPKKNLFQLKSLSDEYFSCLEKVRRKHKKTTSVINTTCGSWSTGSSILLQRIYRLTCRLLHVDHMQ